MFEHASRFRQCRNTGGGNEDADLDVHRIFENDVGTDIILEVSIYIPEHSRRDIDGKDRRSGWWGKLDTTAGHAVVSVSALVPLPSARGQRESRSRSERLGRRGRNALSLASRCCDGRGRSTLLRSGGDRRWGRVESLGPFGFLRCYRGLDLERGRTRGLRRSGGRSSGFL
jgi:hypothetical protein